MTNRQPHIFQQFDQVIAAESLRHGGVSPAPFSSLNLGLYTEDKAEHVEENRRRFFQGLGLEEREVAGAHQVHKDEVQLVEQAGQYDGVDALITDQPNVFLTITVADCIPILIFDADKEVIGAAHAGWRGSVAEIGRKTIKAMEQHFGTRPQSCFMYIGTSIDYDSFEVDNDVAMHFDQTFKKWDEEKQKFFVDLKKFNQYYLEKMGVPIHQIEVSKFSTVKNNEDYFSYRKEKGNTGRALGLIGMRR
jgi:YfiH family protein